MQDSLLFREKMPPEKKQIKSIEEAERRGSWPIRASKIPTVANERKGTGELVDVKTSANEKTDRNSTNAEII